MAKALRTSAKGNMETYEAALTIIDDVLAKSNGLDPDIAKAAQETKARLRIFMAKTLRMRANGNLESYTAALTIIDDVLAHSKGLDSTIVKDAQETKTSLKIFMAGALNNSAKGNLETYKAALTIVDDVLAHEKGLDPETSKAAKELREIILHNVKKLQKSSSGLGGIDLAVSEILYMAQTQVSLPKPTESMADFAGYAGKVSFIHSNVGADRAIAALSP